ncbi:hypothetical protein Hanom_Chr08g00713291 [Helianthus anomalus]
MNTKVLLRSFRQCMKTPAVGRDYSLLKKPDPPGSVVGMRYYSTEKKTEKVELLSVSESKLMNPDYYSHFFHLCYLYFYCCFKVCFLLKSCKISNISSFSVLKQGISEFLMKNAKRFKIGKVEAGFGPG